MDPSIHMGISELSVFRQLPSCTFFFVCFFKDLFGLTICFSCSAEAACSSQAVLTAEIMMLSKCITKRKNFESFL